MQGDDEFVVVEARGLSGPWGRDVEGIGDEPDAVAERDRREKRRPAQDRQSLDETAPVGTKRPMDHATLVFVEKPKRGAKEALKIVSREAACEVRFLVRTRFAVLGVKARNGGSDIFGGP
jgi:hypothetical protein